MYMSQEGDLYFANVEERDSRSDYCCFAAFPKLRTIVQKMPMKLTVNSCKSRELPVLSQCRMQPRLYHPGPKASRSWVGIFCPCLVQPQSPPPRERRLPLPIAGVCPSQPEKRTSVHSMSVFHLRSADLAIFRGQMHTCSPGFSKQASGFHLLWSSTNQEA